MYSSKLSVNMLYTNPTGFHKSIKWLVDITNYSVGNSVFYKDFSLVYFIEQFMAL